MVIELEWCTNLRHAALALHGFPAIEQDDLVGQGHGFDLVVRHVDHGR
jgi:hypothetical protein